MHWHWPTPTQQSSIATASIRIRKERETVSTERKIISEQVKARAIPSANTIKRCARGHKQRITAEDEHRAPFYKQHVAVQSHQMHTRNGQERKVEGNKCSRIIVFFLLPICLYRSWRPIPIYAAAHRQGICVYVLRFTHQTTTCIRRLIPAFFGEQSK